MRHPSFSSDPHIVFLSSLLEDIASGHIQVPRFQRPLVWDWERRRELLRSVRDGIPMGAIMIWRTNKDIIEGYRKLGPHLLQQPPAEIRARQYLLDGVQRLSTLYGTLHEPNSTIDDNSEWDDDPDSRDFAVYYDLKEKDFTLSFNGEPYLLPMRILLDGIALFRFQRSLTGPSADEWVGECDEIANAFRQYKIPVIPITTDDVEAATRTFQKINSQGVRMSEYHMVHALSWSADFDFRAQFAELRHEKLDPLDWGDIEEETVLKACKAALGLDVYKADAEITSRALKASPEKLPEVIESIRSLALFLRERHIQTPLMVPYALQIVVLSHAFRLFPSPTDQQQQLLNAWFWMTTYGELFAGMSGDRVQVALDDMREMLGSGTPMWTWKRPWELRPLARTFDFRAARAKAFAFRLAEAQDRAGNDLSGSTLLSEVGRQGMAQIIPWRRAGKELYSSPANRFLVHPTEVGAFRERLLAGDLTEAERRAHLIPEEAAIGVAGNNMSVFLSYRLEAIENAEVDFIAPLVEPFLPH